MPEPLYSLDASGLIFGWFSYPSRVFPGLWDRLAALVAEGRVLIAQEAYDELKPRDEDLQAWLKYLREAVVPPDEQQQATVLRIMNTYPNLVDLDTGRSRGDPFVIALAAQRNAIVITAERATGSTHGPKIPDVCAAEGIEWGNFLTIPDREGWAFR